MGHLKSWYNYQNNIVGKSVKNKSDVPVIIITSKVAQISIFLFYALHSFNHTKLIWQRKHVARCFKWIPTICFPGQIRKYINIFGWIKITFIWNYDLNKYRSVQNKVSKYWWKYQYSTARWIKHIFKPKNVYLLLHENISCGYSLEASHF